MGNIHSVTKSLESLEEEIVLIKNKNELKNCKALILPGVGSFDPAMQNLINNISSSRFSKAFVTE